MQNHVEHDVTVERLPQKHLGDAVIGDTIKIDEPMSTCKDVTNMLQPCTKNLTNAIDRPGHHQTVSYILTAILDIQLHNSGRNGLKDQ